ncbi:MAG: Heparinase family protein, partial [Phycisphaerales bacterium]|nr:Heparinase family protein [Phycisphaerales bacterium]
MRMPRAQWSAALEPLERRLCLSAAPALAALASPAASPGRAITPKASGPALTLADRQELLANWVGSDKATLTSLLNANNTAGFDNELLNYMKTRTNRHYFFDTSDAAGILNFINGDSGLVNQKNAKIAKADNILAYLFPDAVSSTSYTIQLSAGTVDWLNQPSTSTNTEFLYVLNRHFYWNDLAMAYRFTGDAKYVTELKNQLDSWSRQYTRLTKPDDWISQTVRPKWDLYTTSERVKNWMSAYYMVLGTSGWTAASNTLFLHRLLVQGDFMSRTTKNYELTSNKATGHGTALYELGMMFPEFKSGAAWQTQGANLLFKAIDAQFRADGGHYEQSPGYHGGAMMSYLDAFQLASKNGFDWADKSQRKLRKVFDFYYQLLSPDGTQAALSDTYRSQGTTLFSGASILLGQPQWPKSRPRLDDVWQLGTAASTPLLSAPTVPALTGRGGTAYFADSGYYATRTGEDRDARQLIFDAGPKGDIHGHYDLLNFELYGYQHPLIADPGLLSYSKSYAADRATVISTPAHNTISIDGLNHAASEKSTVAKLTLWNRKPDSVQMAATHYAYAGFKGAPVVARDIWHDRNDVFLVVDFAAASATHTYTQSFNLFTINTTKFSGGVIHTKAGNGDVLLQPLLLGGQTTSAKNAILSNGPPPSGTTTGLRFAINATARSTVFATLVVAYDNGVVPSVSAKWVKMPTATRSGQIELTKNGVKTIV